MFGTQIFKISPMILDMTNNMQLCDFSRLVWLKY